jgi:hypothetical protein
VPTADRSGSSRNRWNNQNNASPDKNPMIALKKIIEVDEDNPKRRADNAIG